MHVFLILYPYNPDSIPLQVMEFILDLQCSHRCRKTRPLNVLENKM
jgi:hypothetical protein